MTKGHNQGIMNDKRSQFSVMNDIVNVKKGHNTVNVSFAHKPDGLLVYYGNDSYHFSNATSRLLRFRKY